MSHKRVLPGDWKCDCGNNVFRSNVTCPLCGRARRGRSTTPPPRRPLHTALTPPRTPRPPWPCRHFTAGTDEQWAQVGGLYGRCSCCSFVVVWRRPIVVMANELGGPCECGYQDCGRIDSLFDMMNVEAGFQGLAENIKYLIQSAPYLKSSRFIPVCNIRKLEDKGLPARRSFLERSVQVALGHGPGGIYFWTGKEHAHLFNAMSCVLAH